MTFFVILLLFFIFIIYILPGIVKWRLRKMMEKRAEDFQRQAQAWENEMRRENRKEGWADERQTPRRKIITKDMGEYVEFEEVTEIQYHEFRQESPSKHAKIKTESQITDVKWEEL